MCVISKKFLIFRYVAARNREH